MDCFLGKWFDAIEENTLPDLLLFKNLLLCQKAFNNKEVEKSKTYFNLALKLSKQNQLEVHPILKARIGVWHLVLNNDKETIDKIAETLTPKFKKVNDKNNNVVE